MLRLSLALVSLLLCSVLLPGCAGGPRGALQPLAPGQLDARVALAEAVPEEGDPVEHALLVAEAELALGRLDRSAGAAMLALRRAELAWWTARLGNDDDAIRAARKTLHRVARHGRRWAERTDDPGLMVAAVLAGPHPRRHRRALRRAIVQGGWPTHESDVARAIELVGDDPQARRWIARELELDERQELGLHEGLGSGPELLELRTEQLDHAIEVAGSRAELRAAAAAVLDADPWEVDAQLLELALDELDAGVLTDDPLLLEDLAGSFSLEAARLARIHLRREATPGSRALPLSLAWWMLRAHLVGDAHGVLASSSIPPSEAGPLRLWNQLAAMTAARRGEVATFERWRIANEVRSPALDGWLSAFDLQGEGPRLRAAAGRARRRRAHLDLPPKALGLRWTIALDPRISAADRDRVRHFVSLANGEVAAWRALCEELHRDVGTCVSLWLQEDVMAGLALASGTPHLHPDAIQVEDLTAASLAELTPALLPYEDTVLAASPEYQEARLLMALGKGDHADARARLQAHGALLYPNVRAWAWLVLDDLESGAASFDETSMWMPAFDDDPTDPTSEPLEPPSPLRLDRYREGMGAAATGRHAAALERLMPVLNAVPDAVVTDGLAAAALAAHRAGDAETRDALRLRLHAVDPHGSAYARMQARISLDAGRPEEARRFLAHALRWHPNDDTLYRRMVAALAEGPAVSDALALGFATEATTSREWTYYGLREQVRRGTVTTLAAFDQVRRAIEGTPEVAWAAGGEQLADFPLLAERAAQWGVQQVNEATDLATAQRWGAQTLAIVETNPPQSDWARSQRIWLSLLLGRTAEGLELTRRLDREHGVQPLSEGASGVLLLQAREAGEIDDALAWDLWRWLYDTDEGAATRVDALLDQPPSGSILQMFACVELSNHDDPSPAYPVCAEAWKAQPTSLALAVSQSYLGLTLPTTEPEANDDAPNDDAPNDDAPNDDAAPEPALVRPDVTQVFRSSVVAPPFLDAPALAVGASMAEPWHGNHAIWLGNQGQHEAAAQAWWQAHAFGRSQVLVPRHLDEQVRFLGPLLRALLGRDEWQESRTLDLRRARLALQGADPTVARAYAQTARARVPEDPTVLSRADLMLADRLLHLADWTAEDLAESRLDPSVLSKLVTVVLEPQFTAAQDLHTRYPEASLTRLALAKAQLELHDAAAARPLIEALLERHPDHPLAVATALPLLVDAGDDDRARALYQAAQAHHPGDTLLRYADAPEAITGPHDGVPAWVRDPARFDERMALVTDARVDGLTPVRHASVELAAELLVPESWIAGEGQALRFEDLSGARMLVYSSPRASRCQGPACARALLEALDGEGLTTQWTRQTSLAGADATQILLTNPQEVVVAWVLPSGGRVFSMMLAAPVDRFDSMRPAVLMLRDGFRPLDGVLPPFAAESLRAAGHGATVDDHARLAGRREQGRASDPHTCPVPLALAGLDDDAQRAELLVDLWLATANAPARQALLRCADARSTVAGRLALVALLDEDPGVHAFGRRAVGQHPDRVTDDVRTILSTPITPPVSAPDYLMRSDLPAHGLIEVLGALPSSHAGPLANRLATSADPHDRALAWAALRLRPALASDAAIEHALADPSIRMVSDAAFVLSDRGQPRDAQRLREQLAARGPAATADEQVALRSLARALATFLDPQDHARLLGLPTTVADGDDPEHAERLREQLRVLARDHARAIALDRDPSLPPGPDDHRTEHWRNTKRDRTLPVRPESDLRTLSLAELLPGHDYVLARLAAPGLFSSTVSDVVERITTGDEAVDQRLGELSGRMLRESGFAALSASGGLDTAKPIECAKPSDGSGWVCTAWVSDREALLAVLGQRALGDDAGVSLPLTVATTAGVVPVVLSLMPAILHSAVYPKDDEPEPALDANEGAERARMEIERGSMRLEHYSIVQARTRRTVIDSERYLFVGDRVWVFATDSVMDRVMLDHEGPVLADAPELRRLTAGWKDGSALQAVALGGSWPWAKSGSAMEVVLDESGLRFRYSGAFDSEEGVGDIGPALAQLPAGAVTTFAHGLGPMPSLGLTPLHAEGPDAARVPPLPVLTAARGVAFGWYLRDGDHLWRRWLAVAPLDDALLEVLRREAITLPAPGKSRRHGGLCYAKRRGSGEPRHAFLLVGDCTLVDEALAGPPPPPPSRDHLRVAHGLFDGPAAAAALPGLDGLPLDKRAVLRAMGPVLGIVTDLRVEANWRPADRVAVLEGNVALRLRPPGDRAHVIDDWLAASEGHNAATLPRRLRRGEIEAPLRYLVEVPDAEGFVRDTLADSPRVQAEVLGPSRVRLTVSPVPATPRLEPLDAKRLEELTKRTAALPIDDPAIVQVARRLAPEGTAPAAAAKRIGAWVHARITYEVTPRSLDGARILETGRGDCTEYAQLTVTLLRAAGVPAEVRSGMAASGDELVAHAWVAYHDGESWHEIDPTWGRSTVSAGHLEMSVLDALALISLGRLQVVEITAP